MGNLVVGFDLNMTLIDGRPGIGAAWTALAAETGVRIDVDLVSSDAWVTCPMPSVSTRT